MEKPKTYRMLIVDDNPQIRSLYRKLLSKSTGAAFDFREANSAEDGLELYVAEKPDCILLDYSMPRMNGLEFLNKIADDTGFVSVPVVMISGQGDERVTVQAIKRGASDYLVKNTITMEALQLAVMNAIGEAESQRRQNQRLNKVSSGAFLNLLPGSVIDDRYTVVRCLGAGAMGKVYLCRDEELGGLPVAMKVLFSDVAEDEEASKRFRNEIIAAYSINHANVVRAFQYFTRKGISAFTMEYVDGGSLAERIETGEKMGVEFTLDFLQQACAGMQAIHEAGIVHRDIKPSNILFTKEGQVKITDFGIARASTAKDVTEKGEVLGTWSYLSPEYLATGSVSVGSDIYSLGIVAYEMLTGVLPGEGENIFVAMKARVEQDPQPLEELRSDCPPGLSRIIMRALKRNPQERYSTAREMLVELRQISPRKARISVSE